MSSGNKPEQSDGLMKTSRHAFSSMVGSGSRSQDLFGDYMIIFSTSVVVAGSNDVSLELMPHLHKTTRQNSCILATYVSN